MVDIAGMRPSALRRLDERLRDEGYAKEFIESLAKYLVNAAPDGGVDSDRLYVVGLTLSNANVWAHIKPADVLERAGRVSSEVLLAFTAGMPDATARQFLETKVREEPVALANQFLKLEMQRGNVVVLGLEENLDPKLVALSATMNRFFFRMYPNTDPDLRVLLGHDIQQTKAELKAEIEQLRLEARTVVERGLLHLKT